MPQVVEANPTQAGRLQASLKHVRDDRPMERPPSVGREHEVQVVVPPRPQVQALFDLPPPMLEHPLANARRHRHLAAAQPRFDVDQLVATADSLERSIHVERAAVQVDSVPCQAQDFRLPQARREGDRVERLQPVAPDRPQQSLAVPPDQTSLTPGEERMTTEDGRNVIVAAVIPHPDGLPEVLLSVRVHGQDHVYSWLGGHVHKGETPEDAVIRELREELVIDSPRVIRTLERIDIHIDASPWWGHRFSRGYVSFNLLVDIGSADMQIIDDEELKGVRWVPLSDRVDEWTRKLPPELRDPAIRSAPRRLSNAPPNSRLAPERPQCMATD